MQAARILGLFLALLALATRVDSPFERAISSAERALTSGDLDQARAHLQRALERDSKSVRAWGARARWAEAAGQRDDLIFSLHRELRLLEVQKARRDQVQACREKLLAVDPQAQRVFEMRSRFVAKLGDVAQTYEQDGRPHSAIRVHKEILALDPEQSASADAIQRLASAPDPSLAVDAKPVDLLEGVSEEWIREFDAEHVEWGKAARLERTNYTTRTNAGYEVLVRAAEAMEQMNAFYRQFFDWQADGGSVGRIDLVIFRTRDEYLKYGSSPVEWSGGQYVSGSAVETFISGGFEGMTNTLFHEAAHQFVDMATSASGWLNEGLASFFEGCRILPNGTVLMNLPANHRLFPLVERMDKGWMTDHMDGIDPAKPEDSQPPKSPTFRIVLENKYEWGPPWYAPTWGVVYFLYNYQDAVDGRYVYRKAFREFINSSGGRVGEGAVKNFEEVVLANPQPPIQGFERPAGSKDVALPKTIGELDQVWKDYLFHLRDEQSGRLTVERPYVTWARAAVQNGDVSVAEEHFEKGLVATPNDAALLVDFADLLAEKKNLDRATKLALQAVRVLESAPEVDVNAVRAVDRKLEEWDPARATLERVHRELWGEARGLVLAYRESSLPLMVMDVSWRMEVELGVPGLFEYFAEAQEQSGKSLSIWSLAYNEHDLDGWDASAPDVFRAEGPYLTGQHGIYVADDYSYRMLGLDQVTSGDFSMQVDVQAERGEVGFCGLVFGRKDTNNFHALIYFPPKPEGALKEGLAASGFVDLATFYGSVPKVWRHTPVKMPEKVANETSAGTWHELRLDVSGRSVDAWVDGTFMATQEFPTADVLRGSFGLILGPGKARFRDVRFLARHPRDPVAALEREKRLEAIEDSGGSADGSWLGRLPPFPQVARWTQEPRESWADRGVVPQLLVLWSIQQNELVPIDAWLRDLAQRHAGSGLAIVAIASPNDEEALDLYLKEHAMPGSVGVDFREGFGIGATNEAYDTLRFNLPRVLLLDIDRKVVWEGDPGFSAAKPWDPSVESYVELPLGDLIARRKVLELKPWVESWNDTARPALAEGDLATALPILKEASRFEQGLVVEVDEAQARLAAVQNALKEFARTVQALAEEGRQPSLGVLLEWATALEMQIERTGRTAAAREGKAPGGVEWERALAQVKSRREKVLRDPVLLGELIAKLRAFAGTFPSELAAELEACAGDPEALARALESAPALPRRWLAREYFGW